MFHTLSDRFARVDTPPGSKCTLGAMNARRAITTITTTTTTTVVRVLVRD